MTDKELKKEKEELLKMLFTKIDGVTNNNSLKEIFEIVKKQNALLDIHDSKFENLLDGLTGLFKPGTKDKIKHQLNDIFDKYDKRNKSGKWVYSPETRKQIADLIEKINKICDETFWDRFLKVLGIGS